MDEPRKHKWKKPETKDHIHVIPGQEMSRRGKSTERESRLLLAKDCGVGARKGVKSKDHRVSP